MKKVFKANAFFMTLLILMIVASLRFKYIFNMTHLPQYYLLLLPEILFLLLPAYIYIIATGKSFKGTLRLNKISISDLFIIVCIGFLSIPVASFIGAVSQIFFKNFIPDVLNRAFSNVPFIVVLTVVAIIPAVCEETVMRGVVLSGYSEVPIKKAAVMNGFLFGLFHLNPQQFFYAFALGTIFAYIVYITNSIFSSMICHFIVNGINVGLSYIALKGPSVANTSSAPKDLSAMTFKSQVAMFGMLFVVASLALFMIIKLIKKLYIKHGKMETNIQYSGERVFDLPVFISIILYFIFVFFRL